VPLPLCPSEPLFIGIEAVMCDLRVKV
jgi:hypothetical protein